MSRQVLDDVVLSADATVERTEAFREAIAATLAARNAWAHAPELRQPIKVVVVKRLSLEEKAARHKARAAWIAEVWAGALPTRIVNEDLFDLLERSNCYFEAHRLGMGWWTFLTAVVYSALNAYSYVVANLKGNRRGA